MICPNYNDPSFKEWEKFLGNREEVVRLWLLYGGDLPSTQGLNSSQIKDINYYKTLSPQKQAETEKLKLVLTNKVSPKLINFDEIQTHELLSGFHSFFIPFFLKTNPRGLTDSKEAKVFVEYFQSAYVNFLNQLRDESKNITNKTILNNRALLINQQIKDPKFINQFLNAYSIYLQNIGGNISIKKKEEKEDTLFDTPGLVNETDKTSNDGAWDKEAYKFSTKDSAPAVVKLFLSGLPEYTNGKLKLSDTFGTKVSSDYGELFNHLANNLTGIESSYDGLVKGLEAINNTKPQFKELLNRLKQNLDNKDKQNILTQFIQTFSKTKPRFILNLLKSDGNVIFLDTNNQRLKNKYLSEWKNNFLKLTGSETASQETINKINTLRNLANLAVQKAKTTGFNVPVSAIPEFTGNYNTALALLGIKFNNNLIYDSEIDGKRFINYLDEFLNPQLNNLNINLFNKASDVTGRLNNIAEQASKFGDDVELQHINAEGETVYGITLNNYLSLTINEINRIVKESKGIDERKKRLQSELPHIFSNPYSTVNTGKELLQFNSQLFRLLTEGHTLELSILEGIRQDKSGEGGTHFKNMGDADKLTSLITNTLNKNYSFFRAGDKSTEYGFSILTPNTNKKVDILKDTDFKLLFHQYLTNEILTSNALRTKDTGADIEHYSQNALNLRIFKEILSGTPNDNTIHYEINRLLGNKNLNNNDLQAFITKFKVPLEDYYEKWMNKVSTETYQSAIKNGLFNEYDKDKFIGISDELFKDYKGSKEAFIRDFTERQVVAYIEQTKLFTGDLAGFKKDSKTNNPLSDFPKRTGMFTGTKEVSRVGEDWQGFKNKEYPRSDEKVLDRDKINTVIYKDLYAKFQKEWLDNLENRFKEQYLKDKYTEKEATQRARNIRELYEKKTNFTDAQGFVTLDEYREIKLNNGIWSDKDEEVYKKLTSGQKVGIDELTYFNVLKTQYVGNLTDTNGISVMTGYKHSLAPLLPSMMEGKEWGQLKDFIKDKKIGIIQFESGVKFGIKQERELNGKYQNNNFYIGDSDVINDNPITQQIDYKYLGIQVQTGKDIHNEVTASTQLNKNILVNQFSFGKLADDSLTEEQRKEKEQIFKDYNDNLSYLIKTPLQLLVKEIEGVSTNNNYSINDRKKLVNLLLEAAVNRNSSNNVLISIEALNRSNAYIDALHNPGKIGSIIMSRFRKDSIDQKRPGSAKIQASNAGFTEYKNSEIGDDLLFYEQSKATEETLPLEISVAFPVEWKSLLGKEGNLNKFNEKVAELNRIYREWHNNPENKGKKEPNFEYQGLDIKLLKGISFRIPHQATASSDLYIIKKFQESSFGDTVLVPKGLTTKVGSDFDVDKFYIYKPNTTFREGKLEYLTSDNDTSTESEIKIRQNKLLENQFKILSMKDNFTNLMTPIDASILSDLAKSINKAKGKDREVFYADMVKPLYNISLGNYFLSGKENIGIVAKHNTNHSIAQAANIYIDNNGENLDVFFDHNKVKIGTKEYASLAGIFTKGKNSKEYISEILNQFLSAYVDVAKDPFVFDLNAVKEVIPVILYMTRIGANIEYVTKFVTQPVIVDFIQEKINNNSEIKQMRDQNKSYSQLIKDYFNNHKLTTIAADNQSVLSFINRDLHNLKDNKDSEEYINLQGLKEKLFKEDINHKFSTNELTENLNDPIDNNKTQGIVLQQYLELERQSQFLTEFVNNTDQDTSKLKSVEDAWTKHYKYQEMVKQGFIGNIENLYTNTFMGAFKDAQDVIRELISSMYISSNYTIREQLKEFKTILKSVNSDNRYSDRIEQIINNDFIDYLMQNSSTDGLNSKKLQSLFDKNNPDNLPNQITKIKNNPKDPLNKNIFIQGFIPSYDRSEQDSIINYNQKLNTYEENRFPLAFREILQRNQKLGEDLIKFAYLQSGSNDSNISWVSKLPSEYVNNFKDNLLKETIHNISIQKINDFKQRFFLRHPELLPRLSYKERQGDNGKYYILTRNKYIPLESDPFKLDNFILNGQVGTYHISSRWDKVANKFKILAGEIKQSKNKNFYLKFSDRFDLTIPVLGDTRFYVDYTNDYSGLSSNTISTQEFASDEGIDLNNMSELAGGLQSIIPKQEVIEQPIQNKEGIDFQEEPTTGYRQRTINNAKADATIAIAVDFTSAGEKLTKTSVLGQNKKYISVDANTLTVTKERVDKIVQELNSVNAKTLNIAGNGIYTMKGKYTQQQVDDFTYDLLSQVLNSPNLKTKIESIRSGGQTGFDEAGAKAGIKLGLPTIILAPKGWTFRNINGQDISNEQQFKYRFVEQPINKEIKPKIDSSKKIEDTITNTQEFQQYIKDKNIKTEEVTQEDIDEFKKKCKI